MADCELCGASDAPFINQIEGATLRVCKRCSTSGKVIEEQKQRPRQNHPPKKAPQKEPESILDVRHDVASVLKAARSKKKMTQQEFSQFLNVKESVYASFENGIHKPSLDLAHRIEKILHIPLLETIKTTSEFEKGKSPTSGGFTLGHFIKKK